MKRERSELSNIACQLRPSLGRADCHTARNTARSVEIARPARALQGRSAGAPSQPTTSTRDAPRRERVKPSCGE